MVGRLAAQVLRAAVRDGAIVGIGDGASVSAVADALDEAATPVGATIVPLAGGYWAPGPEREPFRRIAEAFGAQPHGLMAPGLLDDAATKAALEAHAGVRAVLDLWARLDVALFGIGGRSWGAARSARGSPGSSMQRTPSARSSSRPSISMLVLVAGAPRAGARVRCPGPWPGPGRDRRRRGREQGLADPRARSGPASSARS